MTGVTTSNSLDSTFTDHGKLFDSSEIGVDQPIDPFFWNEDGTPYMVWGSFHEIYGVELTSDCLDYKSGTRFQLAGDAFEAP